MRRVDRALGEYLDYITDGMGRPERRRALGWYLTGLLLEGERKTVVSMAGRLVDDEGEIEAMRQRLQQCVTISGWADAEVRRRVACKIESTVHPEAFVVDDTGFPKKGDHSVGVARQYSGTLGRTDNCQVATSLHLATNEASACIGMRLYLSEDWASDIRRRRVVGVPDEIVFQKKWQIALALLDEALSWGLARRLVLADAAYGDSTEFRNGIITRGCAYLVGVSGGHTVWPPGSHPRLPCRRPGLGRPRTRYRDGNRKPRGIAQIAKSLEYRAYTCVDGKGEIKTGQFAFARVHLAERRTKGRPPSAEIWLICEYRPGNNEYKFYVSDLPATTTKRELARLVKLRWRVERDYQELKGEIGLDHFEGRTWRGFHHHATLCAAAHAFLALQRSIFPPAHISMDSADGPPPDSVLATQAHRDVPPLPSPIHASRADPRALKDVIRSY
jgi:SRSO17 transposase